MESLLKDGKALGLALWVRVVDHAESLVDEVLPIVVALPSVAKLSSQLSEVPVELLVVPIV